MSSRTLALADDPLFDEHKSPPGHPERPERLAAARRGIAGHQGVASARRVVRRQATLDELARVHSAEYVENLEVLRGKSGHLDGDTFYTPRSVEATMQASAAAVDLVALTRSGEAQVGLGLLRPPGHHARPDGGMGFCLLNHVAVAAASALAGGAERVLIVDFDVHHGNGTQEIFESDPRVLFVSLHQYPQYPGTGSVTERGRGEGLGSTVNIPLSAGAHGGVYRAAFERVVLPIAEAFNPSCTLVSAGYDAHARDPLGGMLLDDATYGWMTAQLLRLLGDRPLVYLLEGGYDLAALEGALRATVTELMGEGANPSVAESAGQRPIGRQHQVELERALTAQQEFWKI
jgi:acetoin utilization deacetylase AcuC-like enzyme